MNISQAGVQFIAGNEGYAAHVYNDAGKQAIGYGHDLLPGESFPDGITPEEGMDLLGRDCAKVDDSMQTLVEHGLIPPTVTQNQWNALADFAFNLGPQALRVMLGHGWDQVPTEILRWCFVGHVQNAGLLARRKKELTLFQTP